MAIRRTTVVEDATITALAGLPTGVDYIPYFTGTDTAGQTTLTQVGRDILGKTTAANILTYLGAMKGSNNLSDLTDPNVALNNLGLSGLAAQTASLDPVRKAPTVTLDATNLRATFTSGQGVVLGTTLVGTGKWYFECTFVSGGTSGNASIGVAPLNENLTSQVGYNDAGNSAGVFQTSGNIYLGTTTKAATGTAFATVGNVVGVAIDMDLRKIWFRTGTGMWNGSGTADPATNVVGLTIPGTAPVVPAICTDTASVFLINLGASALAAPAPAGFGLLSSITKAPLSVAPAVNPDQAPQLQQVLQLSRNLSDLASLPTALSNLKLVGGVQADSVGRLMGYKLFTASGTYTPTTGTKFIIAELLGGGGSGGGVGTRAAAGIGVTAAGGGSGGGYGKYLISNPTSYAVTIGAGGTAGAASASPNTVTGGSAGGDTKLGTSYTATGGKGSVGGLSLSTGGVGTGRQAGGLASAGFIHTVPGGNSGFPMVINATNGASGAGGSSYFSAGGQPSIVLADNTNMVGATPTGPGAGGPGGIACGTAAGVAGGPGTSGLIIIWEYA